MPDAIERPAGEPNSQNWTSWLIYEGRRRERAELAGLFFQGERDAFELAYTLTAEQMRQCNGWAERVGEH